MFHTFKSNLNTLKVPSLLNSPFDTAISPLALVAAAELQDYLNTANDWEHNFGLNKLENGAVIGKMFGVLVVKTPIGELGYLAAFSGKLANSNQLKHFVPPIFDGLVQGGFLNLGMLKLQEISKHIKDLQQQDSKGAELEIARLKDFRKSYSADLQSELFEQYHFLNKAGEQKSVKDLFGAANYKNPPSGAGECAAPKLFNYAFQHQLEPIAIAEFWWGLSPKSTKWKHGNFYPACTEKCAPILAHMLSGIQLQTISS